MTSTIATGRPATPSREAATEALRLMLDHVGEKLTEVEWAEVFSSVPGEVSNVRAWALIWDVSTGWSVRRLLDDATNMTVRREPPGGGPYRYWLSIG
jgi:hypothetical protein